MKKLFLILISLLVSCDYSPVISTQEFDHVGKKINLTVVYYDHQRELDVVNPDGTMRRIYGLARWIQDDKEPYKCNIYAVRPTDITSVYHMAILGHELTHCLHGQFHE